MEKRKEQADAESIKVHHFTIPAHDGNAKQVFLLIQSQWKKKGTG
jgi:hypothetical protein